MPTDRPIIGYRTREEGMSCVPASIVEAEDGLCWHPIMYKGVFEHPKLGTFVIDDRNLEGYMASFMDGLPGPGGIPVDERGDHTPEADGAYGWIERIRREGDMLLGGIRWSAKGLQALKDGLFKYISPMFSIDSTRGHIYGARNIITSAALTNRPLFFKQDAIQFAAATELSRGQLKAMRDARSEKWGIEVRADGRLTPASEYRAAAPNPSDYGDPVNLKYPLKPEARLRAAAGYFAQSYTYYKQERSRRVVYSRIIRALLGAGIAHQPSELDKLLPPDLRARVAA